MTTKKLSVDLTNENRKILEDMKKKCGLSMGQLINTMISTFCDPEPTAEKEILQFLDTRQRNLCDELAKSGKFGAEKIKHTLQSYADMQSLITRQAFKNPDDLTVLPTRTITIRDGMLVIPSNWIILNPMDAPDCMYAAAVECRNAEKFGIPHFVFFSNKRYTSEYSDEDIDNVKRLCVSSWPDFEAVLERQVEPIFDPANPGRLQNEDDYMSSPSFEIFTIFEDNDPLLPPDYEYPYGAKIVRTK